MFRKCSTGGVWNSNGVAQWKVVYVCATLKTPFSVACEDPVRLFHYRMFGGGVVDDPLVELVYNANKL